MADHLLPPDEQYVLCHWAVQAVAAGMFITDDQATDLLRNANDAGRLAITGNNHFAGVQVDGQWVVVEGRARLTEATREPIDLDAGEMVVSGDC
jgi:formylmethanofuran dehydrogenase subunit C